MMGAQGLISVMKDGCVAALLEALKQFPNRARGLIADASQVRNGKKFKRRFRGCHRIIFSILESASVTSTGPRTQYWARVGRRFPTNTEMPLRAAANAGSSEKSSPK